MYPLNIKPSEALPTLDHLYSEYFEEMAKSGKWDEVPRALVFEIPKGHILKGAFGTPYVIFEGIKRRGTAAKHHLPYRVLVLEEKDMPEFRSVLEQTLTNAIEYYRGYF